MSKTANKATRATTAKAATKAKANAKAPGNSAAKMAKVQDNLAKLHKQQGKAETVANATAARTGNGLVVTTSKGRSIVVTRVDRKVNELTKLGALVHTLETYLKTQPKPQARLANGVDSRTAPHSAKALRDERAGTAKAEPTKGKGKPRAEKAAKAKAPARGTNRAYKLGTRKDESKPDTFRRYMLTTIMKHKDTDSAKAAHAKSGKYPAHKLDFNWSAQQGYIVFAK